MSSSCPNEGSLQHTKTFNSSTVYDNLCGKIQREENKELLPGVIQCLLLPLATM